MDCFFLSLNKLFKQKNVCSKSICTTLSLKNYITNSIIPSTMPSTAGITSDAPLTCADDLDASMFFDRTCVVLQCVCRKTEMFRFI